MMQYSRHTAPKARFRLTSALLLSGFMMTPMAALSARNCEEPSEPTGEFTEYSYRRLTRVQEHMSNSEYGEALEKLNNLRGRVKSDFELSQVLQHIGYVYNAQEKYAQAIPLFEEVIQKDALGQSAYESSLLNVGQLYALQGNHDRAIEYLLRYVEDACDPVNENTYILLANSYFEKNDYRRALPWIDKALDAKRGNAPESWYQLKLSAHYQLKQYRQSVEVLTYLVSKYPVKKQYWDQLSGVFRAMNDETEALAVLALADRQGFFDTEEKKRALVNFYLYQEIPYKAAELIEAGMESGIIPRNAEYYKKLGDALRQAREYERAIAALTRSAEISGDGDIYLKMGELRVRAEEWDQAIPLLQKALENNVDDEGKTRLNLGVALWRSGQVEAGKRELRLAQRFNSSKREATGWLGYIAFEAEEGQG